MIGDIFEPIKRTFFICLILFLFLLFNFNNKYYQNSFDVYLNDVPLFVYYFEEYLRGPLPPFIGAYNNRQQTNDILPVVNEIDDNNNFKLKIKEYSVYWKDTNERAYENKQWPKRNAFSYKEEPLSKTQLIIKRMDKTLYDGPYIEDVSEYLNGPGRYYFQAIVKRKDNFYTTIKTRMSFNVIIGGGQNE